MLKLKHAIICAVSGLMLVSTALAESSALKKLIDENQDRVAGFFGNIDTSRSGMERVSAALDTGCLYTASKSLLRYLEQRPTVPGIEMPRYTNHLQTAEWMLADKYIWNGELITLPRNVEGGIEWHSDAGTGDRQFLTLTSRHFLLMEVLQAYSETQRPEFIQFINDYLLDWLLHNEFPADEVAKFETNTWARPESFHWVTLNVGIRVGSWLRLWQNFQDTPISDEVRLLMLMSLQESCDFLRWHHRRTGNFKIAEMTAIVETAVMFPEFKNANDWLEYGFQELENELDLQFYPDGAQKELSYHYNVIVVRRLNNVANLALLNDLPISEAYLQKLENLFRYMAYVMRPDGYGPMNGDSDRSSALHKITRAAEVFDNDELRYVTSQGKSGKWDQVSYSVLMPWSGQAVFRSGFGVNDDWSYFEIGPWGIAHQHYDKLHLSVMVGGRDILVHTGRYTYIGYHDTTNPWRNYFIGSDSHNVILIDGIGQGARERLRRSPISNQHYLINEDIAFARGKFDSGFTGVKDKDKDQFAGKASHTRGVLYVQEFGWIVVDHIDTDRPRSIDVMWRFHPDCTVKTDGLNVFTDDTGQGNLRIIPARDYELDLSIVGGRMPPAVQGWYSEEMGIKQPNKVAIYSGKIEGSHTIVWWLLPDHGGENDTAVEFSYTIDETTQTVNFSGQLNSNQLQAAIPIHSGHPKIEMSF